MVSILQKELGRKVKMFKCMRLQLGLVLQPQIKTSPNFQQMNKPYRISSFFINLVVNNEEGGVGGGGLTVGLEQFPLVLHEE